jgi:uncharacterized protein (TIRG00374 family)
MRKFAVAIVLMLGIVYFIARMAELESIGRTMQQGNLPYISLAVLAELLWLLVLAAEYWVIFRALGLRERIQTISVLATAAYFVNIVAPVLGGSGFMVFIAESRRRGHSTARATVASGLFLLSDYVSFLIVLTVGLVVLFQRDRLNIPEILASISIFVAAVLISTLLILGMRGSEKLELLLKWLARAGNKITRPILKREPFLESRAEEFAQEIIDGLRELRGKPLKIVPPILLGLVGKLLLLSIFLLMFLAFGVDFTATTIIAGFSIGHLFTIVSPTPAGVGVVEGALTLSLASLDVPLSSAAVVTLAYRGITFWLPLFIGFLAFRTLGQGTVTLADPTKKPVSVDRFKADSASDR